MKFYLRDYQRPDSYIGPEYHDWLTFPVSLGRDSDALEKSNFLAAWKALSGKTYDATTEYDEDDPESLLIITRASHWNCGWMEHIRLRSDEYLSPRDKRYIAIKNLISKAEELCEQLNEYPILDEELYSLLETEEE